MSVKLYTAKEVAEMVGVSLRNVYAMAHSGNLKSVTTWKGVYVNHRFTKKSVADCIQKRRERKKRLSS